MELVGRMMDGSIPYSGGRRLEPTPSAAAISREDKMERLEAVPIFGSCSRRQLRAIARIAEAFDAPADTILIRAGEPGDEFFLIVEGTARVHVSRAKRLRLRPGDFFGEMSLLDGEPRSATVVAETPLRLLVINRRDFGNLLRKVPGMTENLLRTLSRRLRRAERIPDVSRRSRAR